jgi:hypothetical protein
MDTSVYLNFIMFFSCCSDCYIESMSVVMWHWYNTREIITAVTVLSAGNLRYGAHMDAAVVLSGVC